MPDHFRVIRILDANWLLRPSPEDDGTVGDAEDADDLFDKISSARGQESASRAALAFQDMVGGDGREA